MINHSVLTTNLAVPTSSCCDGIHSSIRRPPREDSSAMRAATTGFVGRAACGRGTAVKAEAAAAVRTATSLAMAVSRAMVGTAGRRLGALCWRAERRTTDSEAPAGRRTYPQRWRVGRPASWALGSCAAGLLWYTHGTIGPLIWSEFRRRTASLSQNGPVFRSWQLMRSRFQAATCALRRQPFIACG